jgi:hypothetical protein
MKKSKSEIDRHMVPKGHLIHLLLFWQIKQECLSSECLFLARRFWQSSICQSG